MYKNYYDPYTGYDEPDEKGYGWGNYGNYSKKSSKKSGGLNPYSYNTFGNYGNWFSNFNYTKVEAPLDESKLICKERGYETPSSSNIDKKLNLNLTEYEYNLTKDIARMFGSFDNQYFKDDTELNIENLSSDKIAEISEKQQLLNSIKGKRIPGFSPLEKAVNAMRKLKKNKKGSQRKIDRNQLVNSIEDVEDMNFDEDIFFDPLIDSAGEGCPLFTEERLKSNILDKICLIKKFGDKFKVKKDVKETVVQLSKLVKPVQFRDYNQVSKIPAYKYSLPYFKADLATKNFNIPDYIEKNVEKQKIILLVDFSGSMCSQEVNEWVCAVLIDRFKYVLKGDAEVFFSYFVEKCFRKIHIKDKESITKFWNEIYSSSPNGGMTLMGDVVEYVKKQVESKNMFNSGEDLSEEKPEILILHDDRDPLHTNKFSYKTNAFGLGHINEELRTCSLKSGGKYIYIDSTSNIEEYE